MSGSKSERRAITLAGTRYLGFPEAGCYYGVDAFGTLWQVPMLADNKPDSDKVEVTSMEDPALLITINQTFGTHFKLTDFAGR